MPHLGEGNEIRQYSVTRSAGLCLGTSGPLTGLDCRRPGSLFRPARRLGSRGSRQCACWLNTRGRLPASCCSQNKPTTRPNDQTIRHSSYTHVSLHHASQRMSMCKFAKKPETFVENMFFKDCKFIEQRVHSNLIWS